MNAWIEMVKEFHEKFGAPVAKRPTVIPYVRAELRSDLIEEEFEETERAMLCADAEDGIAPAVAEIADGLADIIYVCIGSALEYGIPLDAVFAEVHRTNMLKEGGPTRADGKIMKPPGWKAPEIERIIKEAMK